MVKRKVRNPKHATKAKATYSGSDDEQEETSKKVTRKSSASSIICSTPQDKEDSVADQTFRISSSEDESAMETSHAASNGNKCDSFSSLMKMISFESDYEDGNKSLTPTEKEDLSDSDSSSSEEEYDKKLFLMQKEASHMSKHFAEIAQQNIKIIDVKSKNLAIVSLQHPSSLTIHGYLKVSALLGCASVIGYEVKEGKSVKVLSTKGSTLVKVCTVKSVHSSTIVSLRKRLRKLIPKDHDDSLEEFLEQIGPASVVVLVEKAILPAALQFLELYYPLSVRPKLLKKSAPRGDRYIDLCSTQEEGAFNFTEDNELLANEIIKVIPKSGDSMLGPRILVYGGKGCGKSSMLRFIINKALNEFHHVYYLDVDPGQTEFTPPGVVSLIRVTEPLLGPPYSHQQKPLKMVFTGSVSAESSPPMYLKSIAGLINIFRTKFPSDALFVNTMGWIQGIGNICFKNIMKMLDPTIFIEFMSPEKLPKMKRVVLNNGALSFHVPARKPSDSPTFKARDLRHFALMSYFGQSQKYYMEPTYLHAFRPVSVCWDNVAIYVMGEKVPPNRLIETIHCSLVALCRVNRDIILESDKSEYPRTLIEEPLNDCLGFGVVRASDETQRLLYIVTPLSLEELKLVNAIIKGNIVIPDPVYLKQPILNEPLPYTDRVP